MKDAYIRQVGKALKVPSRLRREVLRDLREAFASASEHGESEEQVMERLGPPGEFAAAAAAQFGLDLEARRRRTGLISIAAALAVAAACFLLYAAIQAAKPPKGAIGYSDAMTNIQVSGSFAADVSSIAAGVGLLAILIAVVLAVRIIRRTGDRL